MNGKEEIWNVPLAQRLIPIKPECLFNIDEKPMNPDATLRRVMRYSFVLNIVIYTDRIVKWVKKSLYHLEDPRVIPWFFQ